MTNNEKYGVKITPVPEVMNGVVKWGWKAELQDLRDDKKYDFANGPQFDTAQAAINSGGKSLKAYVNALADVSVYTVNLDAPDVVEETQAEVVEASTDAADKPAEEKAPVEETPPAAVPAE